MSAPTTQTNRAETPPEPLGQLLEAIDRARTLPEPVPYRRTDQDPLERLRRRMRGEESTPTDQGQAARPIGEENNAAARAGARPPSGDAADAVGRQVLALLEEQPLEGRLRAKAVERLAPRSTIPIPARCAPSSIC